MRRTLHVACATLLAALAAACAGSGAPASVSAGVSTGASADSAPTSAAAPDTTGGSTAAGDSAVLVGVDWTLTDLGGSPVSTAGGGSIPTLRLTSESGALTATGMAGCNRFRGTATVSGGELRFGALVSTKMACPALELETRYLAALDGVRGYRTAARQLELLAGESVVARFTAP